MKLPLQAQHEQQSARQETQCVPRNVAESRRLSAPGYAARMRGAMNRFRSAMKREQDDLCACPQLWLLSVLTRGRADVR
jgi:hypothetical protein